MSFRGVEGSPSREWFVHRWSTAKLEVVVVRSSRVPFVCVASCLVTVAALTLALGLSACGPTEKDSHSYFPVNDAGYSYGSADDAFVQERYMREFGYPETNEEWQDYMRATTPDLVLVAADDGSDGYAFERDFGEHPKTIEEAAEVTKRYEEGFAVNVYNAETMEVTGTFTIEGTKTTK